MLSDYVISSTAYCIWSVISSISNLNRWSSSLCLFYHVLLKRDQGNWDWRLRENVTPNAIGCNTNNIILPLFTHSLPLISVYIYMYIFTYKHICIRLYICIYVSPFCALSLFLLTDLLFSCLSRVLLIFAVFLLSHSSHVSHDTLLDESRHEH